MGEKWASLYLVACSLLGDESEAGDWVMAARTEEELARRLAARAPMPKVLPVAPEEVRDHVALLRRRAVRRRRAVQFWGVVAAAVAAGLVALAVPAWGGPVPEEPQRFTRPAVAAAENSGWTFRVHEAKADTEGLTVWWSLSGPGVANTGNRPVLQSAVDLPRTGGEPAATVRTGGRSMLTGQTRLPVVVPPMETVPLSLQLGGQQWAVAAPVDRTELMAMERRVAINEVVSRRGAGVFIKSITIAPGYTAVDWEPWMAPEATRHFETQLALSLRTDLGPVPALASGGPRTAHFAALPVGAGGLTIASNELVWATAVDLPLTVGAASAETGVTLEQVRRVQGRLHVQATVANGYVPVETLLEDAAGRSYRPVSLQIGHGADGRAERWALQASFDIPAGTELRGLQIRVVQQLPPLELALQP